MRMSTAERHYLAARQIDAARLTRRKAAYILDRFSLYLGDGMALRAVKRTHVERWLLDRLQHVVPNTARAELSVVRVFFQWCMDHDLIRTNPCGGVRGPKIAERLPREMPDQIPMLLAAAPDKRMRVVVSLMAHEGLRRAEVHHLTLEEIDLHGRLMLVHGKGSKDRWVPISEPTATAILEYLGEHPAASGPLVRSYQHPSRALGIDRIGFYVSELMRDAGIKQGPHDGRSAHALRHTFAGGMLDNGADPRVLQSALGHQSLGSTWVYTRRRQNVSEIRQFLPSYGP